jgi:tetratricopeptide (TPR) repeat protein
MIVHQRAVSVFLSYAKKDEGLLQELETHLSGLKRQGLVSTWYSRLIAPGSNVSQEIEKRLGEASIILLLVSANFMASNYCYEVEMERAMEREAAGQARVIPIIVRPVDWESAPFRHLLPLPTDAKAISTWRNRDKAFVDVVAGIRRAIEDLSLLPASVTRTALPEIWNIPYSRNSFFTGRDELLLRLYEKLQKGQAMALSQSPQAISGLGGIGKTQMAIEFAYRYAQEYEAVLWARAENKEALIASYNELAGLLKLPERNAKEQEITIGAVKEWLQRQSKWLLILDNADDLDLLPPFLPTVPGGHILLTTRAWDMQRIATRLEVEALSDEQGAELLLRRAGLLAPEVEFGSADAEERGWAMELTRELGGLPLALDQAGAYLEATGMGLEAYRQMYQKRRYKLLQERRSRVADHPDSVASTWSLSFERVEEKNPAAADLLRVCAFLAPDEIPEEILTKGASHLGKRLTEIGTEPYVLNEAIEALRAYSLLSRDPRRHMLGVHRLVQVVLSEEMGESVAREWKERVALAVGKASPNVRDITQRDACERWLPHALLCATWIEQEQIYTEESASLLNETGYYLKEHARYAEAALLYQRSLAIREQQLGPLHPDTALSLNNLALLYYTQGKYAEVEPLYQRALAIYEQQLGPLHPDTALSLNNLALLYKTQGKYSDAEPLYKRALAVYEQQLEPPHPNTAGSLNNLALLYYTQGKYSDAEPLYQRALAINEQQLGPLDPNTARSLNNLALLYKKQGKYAEAEPLYQRALAIYEQQLGPHHPGTAVGLDNLATLYKFQGKYAEAEPLYQRALAIFEQSLGLLHFDTALSLNNLAVLYQAQGKYAEAEPLLQRALAIFEQSLGPEHPDTKIIRENYMALLRMMGREAE